MHWTDIPLAGSDGRIMGVDLFIPEQDTPSPVILYIHGFNGLKDWGGMNLVANMFMQAGFAFVKMNLSHNGTDLFHPMKFVDLDAFGKNNYSKELYDVGVVLNWICSADHPQAKRIDITRIALIGHSRGGGIAILKAYEDPRVNALLTWASVSHCQTPWGTMNAKALAAWKQEGVMYYTNKRTGQQLPLYYQLKEDYDQHTDRFNLQNAAAGLTIPWMIAHGRQDPAVPFSQAQELHAWQPKSKLFEVDSDHVFGRVHPWTQETLPAPMTDIIQANISFLKTVFMIQEK